MVDRDYYVQTISDDDRTDDWSKIGSDDWPDWSEMTELRRFRRETAITTCTVFSVGLSLDNYPFPRFGVGEREVWTLR